MNQSTPQLQAILDDFESATRRLHAMAASASPALWSQRPAPDRWSAAECVAHLNLTSATYLPILDEAIDRGRKVAAHGGARSLSNGPYRRDLAGWLLWKTMPPPVRFRAKTTARFTPTQPAPLPDLIDEFDRLQQEQIARVRNADGLPLNRLKITSPFNARLKYNLYACLTILPRHQHRHLWQAEEALRVT